MGSEGGGFLRQVRLEPHGITGGYPFNLPVVRHLGRAGGCGSTPA